MTLEALRDTPPWDWPPGAATALLDVLRSDRPSETDLLLATELAGDFTVINDDLVDALLSILRSGDRPEEARGRAAISLGPVFEQVDTVGFEDPDELPITEGTCRRIQASLRTLYMDASVPTEVRRRILEASVRAPQDWHSHAVRAAWASDDEAWRLTAVFCMRFIGGFDAQILEALDSGNAEVHYEAVRAAGDRTVDAAWPHVAALVTSRKTEKSLLLAAIDAVASIRPRHARELLADLADSHDQDIADAAQEALVMAEGQSGEEDDDELDGDDEPHR